MSRVRLSVTGKPLNQTVGRFVREGVKVNNQLVTKERLEQAREVSRKVGYTGVSWLQRQMRVGYITASYLLDALVEEGFCVREEGSHIYKVRAQQNAHLTPESLASSQALSSQSGESTPEVNLAATQRK